MFGALKKSQSIEVSRRDLLTGGFFRRLSSAIQSDLDEGTRQRDAAAIKASLPEAVAPGPGAFTARRPRALPIHRPPGAISEGAFLTACTSCDDCAAACPHDAILKAPARMRGAVGTPFIDPSVAPCQLCEGTPCITACQTGALSTQLPIKMGEARIQEYACLAHQGSFCSSCGERCPIPGAISSVMGLTKVDAELCIGCGICQYVCPAPNNAILLLPARERGLPEEKPRMTEGHSQ